MDEQMIADLFAEKLCEWSALGKMDDPTEIAKVAAREAAHSVIAGKVAELTWQPIETAWRVGEQPIIVTDGAEVYGAAWWHSREEAWLDCGGITPTHWMPLPDPPRRSSPSSSPAAGR